MGLPADLIPQLAPLIRSIGASWSPVLPSRTGSGNGPTSHLATSDNLTNWDPYSGGDNLHLYAGDNPQPLPSRPSIGSVVVTPSALWNISGPSGWDQGSWPIVVKGPNGGRYYQFGFQTPGQSPWGTHAGGVVRDLPSVPPPMPFLGGSL